MHINKVQSCVLAVTMTVFTASISFAESEFSPNEMKTLRNVSKNVLVSRLKEKKRIEPEVQEEINAVKEMQTLLNKLEAIALAESFSVKMENKKAIAQVVQTNTESLALNEPQVIELTFDAEGNPVASKQQIAQPSLRNTQSNSLRQSMPAVREKPSKQNIEGSMGNKTRVALQTAIQSVKTKRLDIQQQASVNSISGNRANINQSNLIAPNPVRSYSKPKRQEKLSSLTEEIETALMAMESREKLDLQKLRQLRKRLDTRKKLDSERPILPEPTFETLTKHRSSK